MLGVRLGKSIPIVLVATVLLSGCAASEYRFGVHQLGNKEDTVPFVSVVAEKVDSMVGPVEEQFVRSIAKLDLQSSISLFAPKLAARMTPEAFRSVESNLRAYEFDGRFQLLPQNKLSHRKFDEGLRKEPFEFYDYVGATYRLSGKTDAIMQVFTTQVGLEIRVCGFRIQPDVQGTTERIVFISSETVDKGKIVGREYVTMPQK